MIDPLESAQDVGEEDFATPVVVLAVHNVILFFPASVHTAMGRVALPCCLEIAGFQETLVPVS
jgi:hypothetical protein